METINLSEVITLTIIVTLIMTPFITALLWIIFERGKIQKAHEKAYMAMHEMIQDEIISWHDIDSLNNIIAKQIERLKALKYKNREMTRVLEDELYRRIDTLNHYEQELTKVEAQLETI